MPDIDTVTYEQSGHHIVQGLQYDICAVGSTKEKAQENFELIVLAEKSSREKEGGSLADIGPAPQEFWDMKK